MEGGRKPIFLMEASKLEGSESGLSMNVKGCFPLAVKQLVLPDQRFSLRDRTLREGERRLRILASGNSSGPLRDNRQAPESRKEWQMEARVVLDSTSEFPGEWSTLQISVKQLI